jgi:hypothetical protein
MIGGLIARRGTTGATNCTSTGITRLVSFLIRPAASGTTPQPVGGRHLLLLFKRSLKRSLLYHFFFLLLYCLFYFMCYPNQKTTTKHKQKQSSRTVFYSFGVEKTNKQNEMNTQCNFYFVISLPSNVNQKTYVQKKI